MKIKTVLIAMCSTALLFSSCEKADMDKGLTSGGGILVDNNGVDSTTSTTTMGKDLTSGGGILGEATGPTVTPPITTMGKDLTSGGGILGEIDGYSSRNTRSSQLSSPTTVIEKPINLLRSLDKSNWGVVSVKITNSGGTVVYSNNVDTSLNASLYLNRSLFDSGSYTIAISVENGTIIEYDNFTID